MTDVLRRARAASWVPLLLVLGAFALHPTPLGAQAVYGSIGGTVTDPSGAVLPGVTINITSLTRQTTDSVVTTENGLFVKERLLPGPYKVQAELTGFKTAVVQRIEVGVDSQTPVQFILEVGQLTDQVTVTGGATLLTTDRADVATRFDSRQLTDLPVLDRNFTKFLLLTPGTQQLQWQHAASENPQGSTQTMVNGQHFSGTNYQLDGTDNRDPILGIIVINPTLESVGETKITSQNYDAEFGLAVAGVVSVQTRSGSNSLRGSAFEFFQNDALQARNPFTQFQADPLTGRFIPETKRNQFGASVGGPIVQNRWFYFGDYQGTRATQGGSRLLSVPTAAARGGDLSAYGINIYDPQTGQQFDGNRIPTGRLSQQAQRILDSDPHAERHRTRQRHTRQLRGRGVGDVRGELDERPRSTGGCRDKLNIFGRYSLGDFFRDGPTSFGQGGGQELVSLGGVSDVRNHSLALRHGLHAVADDAGRLPVRVLQLQGQRAAVRLRHDTGGGRRDSRPEHRLDVRLGTAGRFHRRRRLDGAGRIRVRIGSRRQPLQLPARSGREAVPDGRQPHEAARAATRSSSASTSATPTTCACRATRTDPAS